RRHHPGTLIEGWFAAFKRPIESPLISQANLASSREPGGAMAVPPTKIGADLERLLTPKEATQVLRLGLSWLAKARMRGDGPPYVKLRRAVFYRESDLIRWLKAHARLSTSER